jgi:hypothetical protein
LFKSTIDVLIKEISKNNSEFTHLVCNLETTEESLRLYKAVKFNTHLITHSIEIIGRPSEWKEMRLVVDSIIALIELNKINSLGMNNGN